MCSNTIQVNMPMGNVLLIERLDRNNFMVGQRYWRYIRRNLTEMPDSADSDNVG